MLVLNRIIYTTLGSKWKSFDILFSISSIIDSFEFILHGRCLGVLYLFQRRHIFVLELNGKPFWYGKSIWSSLMADHVFRSSTSMLSGLIAVRLSDYDRLFKSEASVEMSCFSLGIFRLCPWIQWLRASTLANAGSWNLAFGHIAASFQVYLENSCLYLGVHFNRLVLPARILCAGLTIQNYLTFCMRILDQIKIAGTINSKFHLNGSSKSAKKIRWQINMPNIC